MESLVGLLGSSAGGALIGFLQMLLSNKERDKDRQHSERMAHINGANEFQKQLNESAGVIKKEETHYGPTYLFNLKFGTPHSKVRYKMVGIPARFHRAIIIGMLASAYTAVLLMCAADPTQTIHSFASEPEVTKFEFLYGLFGYSKTENNIYLLTTGGLILPLLYPIAFILSKWIVGIDLRK